jgi:hypothetical protein
MKIWFGFHQGELTFIVVFSVFAIFLKWKRTVDSIPTIVATAFKETFRAYTTLSMTRATVKQISFV